MAYLSNRVVNLLNLHSALHMLSWNLSGMFFAVFLIRAGVPTPEVFLAVAATLALRFVLRPVALGVVWRIGMRRTMAIGSLVFAAQFPVLGLVDGIGWPMVAWVALSAAADVLYWLPYHAYFASVGDSGHRGKQLGVRQAMFAACDVLGPLAGGAIITWHGAVAAFVVGAVVGAAGIVPLLWLPEADLGPRVRPRLGLSTVGARLFFADAWITAGAIFAWPVVMFRTLGESFLAFGLVASAAGAVAVLANLALGKLVDDGHGRLVARAALLMTAVNFGLRVAFGDNATIAVVTNVAQAIIGCFYMPSLMAEVYNRAKASPSPLVFHFEAEGGWDIGGVLGCLLAAGAAALGSERLAVAVGIGGVVAMAIFRERLAMMATESVDEVVGTAPDGP